MPVPSAATVLAYTSSGVPFQWLTDGYQSRAAADSNQEVLQALLAWDDGTAFLRDAVGYTRRGTSNLFLDRTPPMQCPMRPGLYCDSCRLVDMGTDPKRADWSHEFDAFEQDWCVYELVFQRPAYRVFSNDTLIDTYDSREQNRYCTFERRYVPRERRVSGFLFEYEKAGGGWQTVPDEAAFIPDYQIEYVVTWQQVPAEAVPEENIKAQLLTVNNAEFTITTFGQSNTFPAGTLLFKGPQQGLAAYQGASGDWYENLPYVLAFQPGGWNSYLRPDLVAGLRDYGRVRRKSSSGEDPPYPGSDFGRLFYPKFLA